MAKALNEVTLLGNLGRDPEIRTTPNGNKNATLNIATTESYKDKSGQWQEVTDWHRVIFWDYKAEQCEKNLHKGSKVLIKGKLKTRSYEKDGNTVWITEVIGKDLVYLDPTNNGSQLTDTKEYYDQTTDGNNNEGNDDDLPF